MKNRIVGLDYLRGLMAFAIMIYHYFSWIYGSFDASSFWGRIGIYGVAIFYILSGLTLYLVYENNFFKKGIWYYIKRRVLRIHPLLILTTILTIILLRNPNLFVTNTRAINSLFLNLTGLFGFVDPRRYIATGAWSIGNELFFYSIFPLVIFLRNIDKRLLYACFCLTLFIGIYFAFYIIDVEQVLSKNWEFYINPFNQLFLFIGGILIADIFRNKPMNNFIYGLGAIVVLLLFIFFPISGDRVVITAGMYRLVFSLLSFILVISAFKLEFNLGNFFSPLLNHLGNISYTIYLVHPIIYYTLKKYELLFENELASLFLCLVATMILSSLVYRFYERPFIKSFR
ncbi:acyltransferase [uncultured Croceitalea sp.]|uniref:acyltransferase family protein n=1 Tax=uncultured Croceitalea sp. TaxID=1798908 RepID=UPI00330666DA